MQEKKKKYPMMGVGEKPHVEKVTMPDGQVRLLGVGRGAAWLGCSQQALGQIVRGGKHYQRKGPLEERVREAYPELFEEKAEG